jgi:hypothetical protein
MDPNKALEQARAELERMDTFGDSDDSLDIEAAYDAMVAVTEAFRSLDEWISNGGFLPAAWVVSDE